MGIHRGPNTVKDGLVFGYDTGYGVADNSTATRFYPGEATANIFSNPNFANHTDVTVGTTSVIKQDFGDGRIGIQMIQAGTSDIAGFSMGSYSAPVSAGTYTWSSFIHSTSTGGKVKAQITVYVNGTRHWLTNSNTWTTSVTECTHLFIATVANQWHRIENQFTLPTGTLTNLQLGSFYRNTSNFTIKIANAQLELKSHTTPFVNGTRSSTASLIDLKKTTDIDVSNVSFDSTGQPDLDGTGDFIKASSTHSITGDITLEAVFNEDTSSAPHTTAICTDTGHQYGVKLMSYKNSDRYGLWLGFGSSSYVAMHAGTLDNNTTYHLVGSWKQSTGVVKVYLNGVLKSTLSTGQTSAISLNEAKVVIGADYHSLSYGLNGKVYVGKVYQKVLTDDQVKQSYNAYKNRFDI